MEIQTKTPGTVAPPWLPSLDLHAEGDELVLHAEARGSWMGFEVALEDEDLNGLLLPFSLADSPAVRRPSPEILEVRIHVVDERRTS